MFGHLIRNRHLLITCDERNLSCSSIAPLSQSAPYELIAYQRYPLTNNEMNNGRIHNISALAQHITSFINAHNVHHAFVSCALNGPGLTETIIRISEPTLSATTLMQKTSQPLIWHSSYLYPADNAQHTFYACGIPRELLVQYHILSRKANITLNTLTSSWFSQLQLYRALHGAAFRPTQLANTLPAHNHRWKAIITRDAVHRMLHIPPQYADDTELPYLKSALGLFIGATHG